MPLNPQEQLQLDDRAAHEDWDTERIERATVALTSKGTEELAHQEKHQEIHDDQASRGLGLTALKPEQIMELDELAATEAGQDRVEAVQARMENSNK